MILIVVKWHVRPEFVASWPELVDDFTRATRAEPGNKWFEWSRSLEDPSTYVLVEAFEDDAAEAHVTSEHFTTAMAGLGTYLVERPQILNTVVDSDDWSRLGEVRMSD